MSVVSGWYPDPAGMPQLRFWDGQTWTSATAPSPVMTPPPPVYQDPRYGYQGYEPLPPEPPSKGPGRGRAFYGVIAGVAVVAVAAAFIVGVTSGTHQTSSVPPNVVTPEQHNAQYDAATKSDVRNGSMAEETYFTDNNTYTTDTGGTPGGATGLLTGFTKSPNTNSVTFSLSRDPMGYMVVGVSKSGRAFCFNSENAAAGVVAGSTC